MLYGICKKYMLVSSLLCLVSLVLVNVNNVDFENWLVNIFVSWSIIDSGISFSVNSNVVYLGNYLV